MDRPEVRFVDGAEGRVAYQVVGDGPADLLFMPFFARWNLDVVWEHPPVAEFLRRLGSIGRLLLINPRGTAISDPLPHGPQAMPEDYVQDAIQVMDAVGSRQAGIVGFEGGGLTAVFMAAAAPDRVTALAIMNSWATWNRNPDFPLGMPPAIAERFFEAMANDWGTGRSLDFLAPAKSADDRLRHWWARLERQTVSAAAVRLHPSTVAAWDVRSVLPSIRTPTLVIEHDDVPWLRRGHGRYIADRIDGARYLARAGTWSGLYWEQDADWVLDEIRTLVTGVAASPQPDDRVLATVMFTDIVASTEHAASLGDARWREQLDVHDRIVDEHLGRFRGRRIKSTGDGILATFDGPARAIRCARALSDAMSAVGMPIRTGLHTGEVELRGDDIAGIAVVIGARVMTHADGGEILVSGAVPPLVAGSGLAFEARGQQDLKGVPGDWELFAVASS